MERKPEQISRDIAAFERKLSEAGDNQVLKEALTKKIKKLKDELKGGSQSTKQLAYALLGARKKVKELAAKDFRALMLRLSKKPEYDFLKRYSAAKAKDDMERKAKPVGYRFKGRGNYDTPTKREIAKGLANKTVYYEGRPRRSDVSQVIQLAKGGGVDEEIIYHNGVKFERDKSLEDRIKKEHKRYNSERHPSEKYNFKQFFEAVYPYHLLRNNKIYRMSTKYAKGGEVINENKKFKKGTYYVGDLCYVMKNQWDELCDLTIKDKQVLSGVFTLKDGTQFAIYHTAYGDGQYYDQEGNLYPVDSGSLGCVKVSSKIDVEEGEGLGMIVEMTNDFTTGYNDEDQTEIFFDNIIINTGDQEEDYEDDYDEDEDEMAKGGGIGNKIIKIENLEVYNEDLGLMTWNEATKKVKELGDGWRLPTEEEFTKILNKNKNKIPILKQNENDYFWTSTDILDYDSYIFDIRELRLVDRNEIEYYILPVRDLSQKTTKTKMAKGDGVDEKFSGKTLKSQRFIEMCIAVADKYKKQPKLVREELLSHTLSYKEIKNITDNINKI